MARILLGRHADTEPPATSVHTLFSGIERILATNYDVLRVPAHESWSNVALETWLSEYALEADLFVGSDPQIIRILRMRGWNGKVIFKALGDLPHGALGLRYALPYLHRTDVVWCSSVADKRIYEVLVEQDGTQPEAIVLPYGIDCGVFSPLDEADKERLRRAWDLTLDDFVVVYAGRITMEKNFHSILEAIRHLLHSGARLKLLVARKVEDVPFRQFHMHGGDLDAKIQELVEDLGLSAYVRFVPWLDHAHLNELHNVGDVFINLTLAAGENFGYAQVEAMSAGLPVIATAWGGLIDSSVDGCTGFLADTWVSDYGIRFDMPKIVNALQRLLHKPALRRELGAFAAQRAREQYAWPVYSRRLLTVINALLNATDEPSDSRLTEFGAAFHSRFSVVGEANEGSPPRYPVFSTLADPHYAHLIEPYTSRGRVDGECDSDLFAALPGRIVGKFFYSTDLLWPVRIPIDDQEAQILRQLSRYQPMTRRTVDGNDHLIRSLVKKGLVGISH